ncbi:hypothetical protein, partial [Thiolapillus sp.]|uniref:hypothetical protein n=1 Tax=Thiolapillus sp. TaxID=2017437 RepID=UPI003AF7D97C
MLTRAATDPVWYGCRLSSHGESRAKYSLAEPIPLQVEHVAVESRAKYSLAEPIPLQVEHVAVESRAKYSLAEPIPLQVEHV